MDEEERIRIRKEKERIFYSTYDPMDGVMIAVILGGFFAFIFLIVLYKAKCKPMIKEFIHKNDEKPLDRTCLKKSIKKNENLIEYFTYDLNGEELDKYYFIDEDDEYIFPICTIRNCNCNIPKEKRRTRSNSEEFTYKRIQGGILYLPSNLDNLPQTNIRKTKSNPDLYKSNLFNQDSKLSSPNEEKVNFFIEKEKLPPQDEYVLVRDIGVQVSKRGSKSNKTSIIVDESNVKVSKEVLF